MRNYFKVMLGPKSAYVEECYKGNFIGADYGIHEDLTGKLPEDWRDFNHQFIPVYLADNPGKTKVAAGLACGGLWTLCKGIKTGDIVVCPNGKRVFLFGEVTGDYSYHQGEILPHRRTVKWYSVTKPRAEVSEEFNTSTYSQGTIVIRITKHAKEIDAIIGAESQPTIVTTDATVEDPSEFALEKHLEDFLVKNWHNTELGKKYDVYEEEGEIVGQQYPSDTGPIDILAISKDKKELLVVELKKGRASDNVVGQIQRYMGYVQEELAENGQTVKGVIIALENDKRIKRALAVATNIEFYQYQVSFKLFKP